MYLHLHVNESRLKVLIAQLLSCVRLFATPMDCSPSGSSVHGISQARILEWVAISFSRGFFRPRDETCVSCLLHWQVGSLPLSYKGSSIAGMLDF